MKNQVLSVLGGLALAIGLISNVQAAVISYSFSGVLDGVPTQLRTFLSPGQAYSGSFTVDDSVTDAASADPTVGIYSGAITEFSLQVGSSTFGGSNGSFDVFNENPGSLGDRLFVTNHNNVFGPSPTGLNLTFIRLFMSAPAELNLVTSDGIINSAEAFANARVRNIQFAYFTPDFSSVLYASGSVDSVAQTAVPEPAPLALISIGLVGFWFSRRKKRMLPGILPLKPRLMASSEH